MLTHHQILALAAPYTRQGLHVDLTGSDRLAGRHQFKPLDRAGELPCTEAMQALTRVRRHQRQDLVVRQHSAPAPSSSAASCSRRASLPKGPVSMAPMGKPPLDKPAGSAMLAPPVALASGANGL